MSKSIITNATVDTTFEGVPCLLKRTIVKVVKEGTNKTYFIVTERCNMVTESLPKVSLTPNMISEENIEYEDVTYLKAFSQKDTTATKVISFTVANQLYEAIKADIPEGLNKMETEEAEEQLALLLITKQEKPWDTAETVWELLN